MQESSQKITQYKTPVDPKFVTTNGNLTDGVNGH